MHDDSESPAFHRRISHCEDCGGYWPADDDQGLGELEEVIPEHVCISAGGQVYLREKRVLNGPSV